jgi:hypothetical protein
MSSYISEKYLSESEVNLDLIIMDFIKANPNSEDKSIHKLAKDLNIDTDQLEEKIYKILGSFLGYGKANKNKFTENDADPEQLKMGIEIEMEHTNNKWIAKRIALDHLSEQWVKGLKQTYYTDLKQMEKKEGVED